MPNSLFLLNLGPFKNNRQKFSHLYLSNFEYLGIVFWPPICTLRHHENTKSNNSVQALLQGYSPLGCGSQVFDRVMEQKLGDGDQIFVYTDGLVENNLLNGKPLGSRHLVKSLKSDGADQFFGELCILADRYKMNDASDDTAFIQISFESLRSSASA